MSPVKPSLPEKTKETHKDEATVLPEINLNEVKKYKMNKYESGEKNLYKYDKEEFSSNKYEDKIPNKYEKEPEKPIYKHEDK